MKKLFWIISLIAASCTYVFGQAQDNDNSTDDTYYDDNSSADQTDGDGSMSYQTFYDQLSPYGSWINYPGYGYCWVPQADAGFEPYETDGDWQYTDYGWTWVSTYPWGWATFHYGRWFFDAGYGGWLWMPGYDWAPAWVTWGNYGGYYCWTPIGPRDFVNGRWGYGAYQHNWYCIPREHMGETGIGRFIVHGEAINHDRADFEKHISIINHTNTYSRSVYNAGPKVEDVQKATGRTITHMAINNSTKPGKSEVHGNTVNVYRPSISRTNTQHAVPAKVTNPSEEHNDATPSRSSGQQRSTTTTTTTHTSTPSRSENTNTERSQPAREPSGGGRQSAPAQQYNSGGGYVPSARPSAPAGGGFRGGGMGGGGGRGGGGRHR